VIVNFADLWGFLGRSFFIGFSEDSWKMWKISEILENSEKIRNHQKSWKLKNKPPTLQKYLEKQNFSEYFL
jgi:predicted NAD/FAD-binding protein